MTVVFCSWLNGILSIQQHYVPKLALNFVRLMMVKKGRNIIIMIIIIIIYLFTAIGLSPGGSGYFTCIQNKKLVTNKFKSGGLHEKHVVATWNVGNRLSVCL